MLLMFTALSCTLSLTFIFLKHPLSLGFILLIQTIIISATSGLLSLNFWFSYILFLIMIGGMLVLFIYMTSVASNEKFKFSKKLLILYLIYIFIMMILLFSDSFFSFMDSMNYDYTNQSMQNINLAINKFVNYPNILVMILLMVYLLATLIAIVKITQTNMGPLRQTSL